jgi:hypothetical protein
VLVELETGYVSVWPLTVIASAVDPDRCRRPLDRYMGQAGGRVVCKPLIAAVIVTGPCDLDETRNHRAATSGSDTRRPQGGFHKVIGFAAAASPKNEARRLNNDMICVKLMPKPLHRFLPTQTTALSLTS